jgi:hypothetical protein
MRSMPAPYKWRFGSASNTRRMRMVAIGAVATVLFGTLVFGCRRTGEAASKSDKIYNHAVVPRVCANAGHGPPLEVVSSAVSGHHASIAGRTSRGATVYVNAVRIDVSADGTFSALVATYGLTTTVVVAFDDNGCTEWHFDEAVIAARDR